MKWYTLYIYIYIYIYIHIYDMYTCIFIYMYIYVYWYICSKFYVSPHIYIYVDICVLLVTLEYCAYIKEKTYCNLWKDIYIWYNIYGLYIYIYIYIYNYIFIDIICIIFIDIICIFTYVNIIGTILVEYIYNNKYNISRMKKCKPLEQSISLYCKCNSSNGSTFGCHM